MGIGAVVSGLEFQPGGQLIRVVQLGLDCIVVDRGGLFLVNALVIGDAVFPFLMLQIAVPARTAPEVIPYHCIQGMIVSEFVGVS